jgi:GntR family transcriptional regulator, transcriptional repressor for pyruvate dehydrogenase complex
VPFQPVQNQRLYEKVAEQIGLLIAAGEFKYGDRLPAERELARKIGVSRPVLREALVTLEISGLVEVRGGSGCFVTATPDTLLPDFSDGGPSPFEIIHARSVIEAEIAALAAGRATPQTIAGLNDTIAMMRADIAAARDTRDTDKLFHIRLAEIGGNSVLTAIVGDLWSHMTAPVFNRLGAHSGLRDTDNTTVLEHISIIEAVTARDADRARSAMAAHLERVRKVLLEGAGGERLSDR